MIQLVCIGSTFVSTGNETLAENPEDEERDDEEDIGEVKTTDSPVIGLYCAYYSL